MAEGIVDVAKVVHVDTEHRQRLIGTQGAAHALLEAILKHLPIAGAGQRIEACSPFKGTAQPVAFNGVLQATHHLAG